MKGRRLALFALSVTGYLVMAYIVWWGFSVGHFHAPGGDAAVWDRAGDQVRAGINPYERVVDNPTDSFWYAPPFAAVFAVTSILPPVGSWLLFCGLEIGALRYVAGSWRNVGIAGLFPLTAFELVSGNFNLVIAAGIVAAVRGRPELATWMSFAKLAPGLAASPADWRRVVVTIAVGLSVSLPVLWLWPLWIETMIAAYGQPLGMQIPVSFPVRLALAGGLLLLWRPWSRALAAVIAIPAFYWGSVVLLLAPLRLRDDRRVLGREVVPAAVLQREHEPRRVVDRPRPGQA
jgi:hypothetical protein